MDVLARPWNGLIIATLAENSALRFRELRERLTAMGDRMLSSRLKELEAQGLVTRRVLSGPPVRVDYALTDAGRGFRDVALAISTWGHRFAAANGAQSRRLKATRKRAKDHEVSKARRKSGHPL